MDKTQNRKMKTNKSKDRHLQNLHFKFMPFLRDNKCTLRHTLTLCLKEGIFRIFVFLQIDYNTSFVLFLFIVDS